MFCSLWIVLVALALMADMAISSQVGLTSYCYYDENCHLSLSNNIICCLCVIVVLISTCYFYTVVSYWLLTLICYVNAACVVCVLLVCKANKLKHTQLNFLRVLTGLGIRDTYRWLRCWANCNADNVSPPSCICVIRLPWCMSPWTDFPPHSIVCLRV